MNWKKLLTGGLVGLLLIMPITAIMYLGQQVLDAPFAPFDTFNWVSGVLPGPVITFGIDMMIGTLRFLGIDVASAAKTGEQTMAIGLFTFLGVLGGALYFFVVSLQKKIPLLGCSHLSLWIPQSSRLASGRGILIFHYLQISYGWQSCFWLLAGG